MEEMNNNVPWQAYPGRQAPAPASQSHSFPAGKKELIFGVLSIICGLFLCNFTLFGGFNLGFAIAVLLIVGCSVGYLKSSGCALNGYGTTLLLLSLIITLGFARSDDVFVKLVMVGFLLVSVNLGLCLTAGQNRRATGGIGSLLDAFRALFVMGIGKMGPAFRGLGHSLRGGSPAIKKGGSVLLGLVIAVPILAILIPMLMSADAAFEGLIDLLPEFDPEEGIVTAIFGSCVACMLYSQAVGLRHAPKDAPVSRTAKGTSPLTVNTVLVCVCAVYLVYLMSQLAYFVGGFSGILPKEFTMAQYARRGFFEMAWLCAIDLGLIALFVGIVSKKEGKAPLSTRLLCLFIGIVTLFMVAAASAKMFMYIDSYGLTRLRVLTEVIMIFLAMATAVACLWLFLPKMPYMKVILLVGLVIGAAVLWADVDSMVAGYNVSAYQDGRLETVDVGYLATLNDSAIPHILELTADSDPKIAEQARNALSKKIVWVDDFRDWNFATEYARQLLETWTGGR